MSNREQKAFLPVSPVSSSSEDSTPSPLSAKGERGGQLTSAAHNTAQSRANALHDPLTSTSPVRSPATREQQQQQQQQQHVTYQNTNNAPYTDDQGRQVPWHNGRSGAFSKRTGQSDGEGKGAFVAPRAHAMHSQVGGSGVQKSFSQPPTLSNSTVRRPWSRHDSSPYGTIASYASSTTSPNSRVPIEVGLHDHDPSRWHTDRKEDDDSLHDPDTGVEHRQFFGWRGFVNIGTMILLTMGILMLFMGYPVMIEFYFNREGRKGAYGLGGTNMSGQVPDLSSLRMRQSLIDLDTPASAQVKTGRGRRGREEWSLVFSDEFNVNGRSFYPGDDPYWEAHNLYAHGTGDYEWYDPAAITTKDGALTITVIEEETHNLNFRSGQLTSWNQFCFTGGYLEASVVLPGQPDVSGWWPAIWTMGNLGRANYGATTEGTWPYSYDTCDRGALINQTDPDGRGPEAAISSGKESGFNTRYHSTMLSWQPGQRLSACTCDGEDHPGPKKKDGTMKGRSAPEIDLFEAQVNSGKGSLSLSAQFMPANAGYYFINTTGSEVELNEVKAGAVWANSYRGSVLQMSASSVAPTNLDSYQHTGAKFSTWGVEYEPGPNGYISWFMDGVKAWHMEASAVGPDALAGIAQRPIPEEPMYIIMNVALSSGFGAVEWDKILFPATMQVDYVRLYQPAGKTNVGCDPPDFPTKEYIDKHIEAYTNPNLTIWGGERETGGYGAYWPRNRLYENGNGCSSPPRKYPGRLRPNGEGQAPDTTVPRQFSGLTTTTTTNNDDGEGDDNN